MQHSKGSHLKAKVSDAQIFKDSRANVFGAKFSHDGNYLAVSHADGTIHIRTLQKASESLFELHVPTLVREPSQYDEDEKEPESPHANVIEIAADHSITGIAWRPHLDSHADHLSLKQELKAVTADGRILSWSSGEPQELSLWH